MLPPPPPPPVVADIRVLRQADASAVELRVRADPPRALRWTLDADMQTAGGHSRTRQSGAATGASETPVAQLQFGPATRGVLTVTLQDANGLVLRRACSLGPEPGKDPPPC